MIWYQRLNEYERLCNLTSQPAYKYTLHTFDDDLFFFGAELCTVFVVW